MALNDEGIISLLAKRDEKIFGQVFKTHFKSLHAYAFTIVKDEYLRRNRCRISFTNFRELHFPMPLAMAFLAKGSELAGSVFVFPGLFTRAFASLIAFTMLVATLTANLGADFNIDGGFTISYFMFALILIVEGGGKYSLDYLLFGRKTYNKNFK